MCKKTFFLISLLLVLGLTAGTGYAARIPIPAGFPNADTTGIKGAGLTEADLTSSGAITVTTDGTIVELKNISGGVQVQANNVTIRKCKITGGMYGVNATFGYTGTLVEDCTITDGGDRKGICGSDITIRRCDISDYQDGIFHGSNITIEDSYVHDLYTAPELHNDCVQSSGDDYNITLRHNTLQALYQQQTSAIIYQTNWGPLDDVLIENNFLSGGAYTVYLRDKGQGYGPPTNVMLKDNVFEYDSYAFGHLSVDGTHTYICNVWDDGSPIPQNPACEPNQPPGQASSPSPADTATDVSTIADLSWTAGSGATSHDVYFGTASPGTFQGNQTATTFDPGTMANDTTYYWRIDEVNTYGTTTGIVWSFTTEAAPPPPPGQATDPSPADSAADVSVDADLSWAAGSGATSHDVYFGTTSPGTFQGNQTATTFEPGTMPNETTYYWRIDEVNAGGTTTGVVWSFTTEAVAPPGQASNPSPANGATDVGTTADLSWTAGSGATSHDVYFGTTSPGTFQGNQTATTFDPGTMANETTYYWRIDEVNGGGTTTGVVWSFTTAAASGGYVTFDVSGSYNYDAVATQAEADNRTSGQNIYESYGDHQPWSKNRTFAKTELGRDGMPTEELITTTYGDYQISTAYDESTPTPGSNSPHSVYLYRTAGGATPGTVSLDVDLPGGQQGSYISVNFLGVGSSSDTSSEGPRFIMEVRYSDATSEAIYTSGLNSSGNQICLPSAVASAMGGLGFQSADAMTTWCMNNSGGQVLFNDVDGGSTVNLWEVGGDSGFTVNSSKTLVGFTLKLEQRDDPAYCYAGYVTIFAFSGESAGGAAPGQATNPSPADAATDVGINADLSWIAGSGADSHDVYFGTTSPGDFQGNQTTTTFDPGTMSYDTTYHWRIDEKNANGTTTGVVWSFTTETASDTTPPSPDPMTWATVPYATGTSSISMTATTATDASGVEYYFDETSGNPGGTDSGWQDSPTYEDTGLNELTQYTYEVKARDKSANQNETAYSTSQSATTEDGTAPSPDPMTWATVPYTTGPSSISMTATTATDASGVEYYFDCTAGGGNDSGWQDSATYEDTSLDELTQYTYQVKARDKSANQNETAYSTSQSATTQDGTAPSPDPMTWATQPYATGTTSISMTATTATDASGVEYYFDETSGNPGGNDSGWQDSATYQDAGLSPSTQYSYQVKARDKSGNQNETSYSTIESATTDSVEVSPVSWWKLDESSGTNAADSSGNGHDGTLSGGSWAPTGGKFDGAVNLGAVNTDYVQVPTTSMSASAGTISVWGRIEGTQSGNRYFFGHTSGSGTTDWADRIQIYMDNGDNQLDLGLGDTHSKQTNIQTLSADTWYHIALTWDGANYVVYVDGIEKASGTYTGLATLNTIADIGNNGCTGYRIEAFQGLLDEVRIYDEALSKYEIADLAGITVASDPSPADSATGVDADADLSWSAGYYTATHDVYLGTDYNSILDANQSSAEFQGNQTATTYDPCTMDADTTYYWAIDEVNDTNTWPGDVWSFTTAGVAAPGQASNPSPADSATDVSIDADLSWTAGFGADSHDVYFGTTSPGTFQGNQTTTTFEPGTMANYTTYYWRIDEVNAGGTTTGIVWSFGTEAAPPLPPGQASNPSPANGATDVSVDADLNWTAGFGADSHDVYFGTTSPGTFQGNQTTTTFEPGTMANDTTYYWRIDEVNAGGTTTGVVWSFTTQAASEWTQLTYDDFETGWGSYTDGGGDCRRYTGSTYAHQGACAINIQDNSGVSSSFYYTNGVDVDTPAYTQIEIDFWFYPRSMESGEDFWVQYYDGTDWHTVASYASGTDFSNGQFYHELVYVDETSYTFPTGMKIRFMCDASGNGDDIYIDEVKVSAK